jgi:hypothetical protein
MAEAAPVPSPSVRPEAEYQPLSGFALAAMIVAGLFGVILLGLVLVGVFNRRPLDDGWHLWLAVLGLILASLARIQIRRSEGIRSGMQLANLAWWICLLGGGGYFAYLQANEYSLRIQSGKFMDAWYETLKKGDRAGSFLLTLEAERRRDPSLNPADPDLENRLETDFAHLYPGYRGHALLSLFSRNRDAITVTRQGLKSWEYRTAATAVDWSYRILTPEGVSQVSTEVLGSRPKGEKGIFWRLDLSKGVTLRIETMTTFGRMINFEMLNETDRTFLSWLGTSGLGYKMFGFERTLPPSEREEFTQQWLTALAMTPLRNGITTYPDDHRMFTLSPGFFRNGRGEEATDVELTRFQRAWQLGGFRPPMGMSPSRSMIYVKDGEIYADYGIEFTIPDSGDNTRGVLTAKLLDPDLKKQLLALREAGQKNPQLNDDGKTKLAKPLEESSWQIVGISSNLQPIVDERMMMKEKGP